MCLSRATGYRSLSSFPSCHLLTNPPKNIYSFSAQNSPRCLAQTFEGEKINTKRDPVLSLRQTKTSITSSRKDARAVSFYSTNPKKNIHFLPKFPPGALLKLLREEKINTKRDPVLSLRQTKTSK
jgi:hypothetical protein